MSEPSQPSSARHVGRPRRWHNPAEELRHVRILVIVVTVLGVIGAGVSAWLWQGIGYTGWVLLLPLAPAGVVACGGVGYMILLSLVPLFYRTHRPLPRWSRRNWFRGRRWSPPRVQQAPTYARPGEITQDESQGMEPGVSSQGKPRSSATLGGESVVALTTPVPGSGADSEPIPSTPDRIYATDSSDSSLEIPGVSPFLRHPLFALEDPGNRARVFQLGKDPTQLCQDSFSCDPQRELFVVTDGVSNSLMPAPWARILARNLVRHGGHFRGEEDFTGWLNSSTDDWRLWMYDVWASTLGHKPIEHWHQRIHEKPAQSTLIACTLNRTGRRRSGAILSAVAIGDCDCLIFQSGADGWELRLAYPLDRPELFTDTPDTLLATDDPKAVEWMFRHLLVWETEVLSGELVVIASDSVAKWIVSNALASSGARMPLHEFANHAPGKSAQPASTHGNTPPHYAADWQTIFTMKSPQEFEQLMRRESRSGRLEVDDYTLVVVRVE